MKELSIEEKAKAYDEAIERAKGVIEQNPLMEYLKKGIEYILPELKDSEDERIRKALLNEFIHLQSKGYKFAGLEGEDILAWLEKQGEQKTTLPKWKYKKDHAPLLRDSLILNKYGCVAKSPSGALVSDVWVIDYDELAKLPKEELEKQGKNNMGISEATKQKLEDNLNKALEKETPESCNEFLEKQNLANSAKTCKDEQKPADNVEPKFKVGDWLVENEPNNYARFVQILEVINIQGKDRYRISRDLHNDEDIVDYGFIKYNYHSFNIKEAEAGDVLSYNDGHGNDCLELIKSNTDKKIEFWFCLSNGNRYEVFDGITPYTNHASREDATPATKEQRDLLFQKMKEVGYEWDAEKLELKKIEDKPVEWSEEDYKMWAAISDLLFDGYKMSDGKVSWNNIRDWLLPRIKSLRPQNTWKPSESDIKILEQVIGGTVNPIDYHATLYAILEQLKKLKG